MEESLFGSTWLRCSLQQPARGTLATATTGCAHSIVHRPLYASKCPWSWSTAPNRSRIALPSALRTIAQLKRSFTVSLGYNGLVCLERSDVPLHPVRMPTLSNLLQFSSLSRYLRLDALLSFLHTKTPRCLIHANLPTIRYSAFQCQESSTSSQ
jgi:hypothetical protein